MFLRHDGVLDDGDFDKDPNAVLGILAQQLMCAVSCGSLLHPPQLRLVDLFGKGIHDVAL